MAIDFPTSPSPNQLHTVGSRSWTWNNSVGAWYAVNAGVQGIQGIQGAQGTQGLQGTEGSQGVQGIQGTQGAAGFVGSNGAQGTQGEQGIQGIQGIQGTQGTQGIQGIQGITGSQGTQGTQGLQGITGAQGTQGAQGLQGTQGTQGIQGIQGITGIQGAIGSQGTLGTQGAQGTQGIQGISGASILGTANTFTNTNAFTSISATGTISASGTGGFASSTYAGAVRNPIWRFGNADGYGFSYFQGGAGIGSLDTIGFHFGTATAAASTLQINQSGGVAVTGTLSNTTGANFATSSGNVGIGTASPSSHLHVYGSGEQYIYNQSTTAHCFIRQYPNSGSSAYIENGTVGSDIYFRNSVSTSCDTTPVTILSSGNVGIGTTSPQNKLHVINGSANTSGDSLTVATLHVTGPNVLTTTSNATLIVATNDALGIDIGGSIGFAGRYSGTSQFTAAQISGRKEDATAGNYGGYLAFCTRANGTQLSEKVRISGAGNVGIGTTSPGSKFHIFNSTATSAQAVTAGANLILESGSNNFIEFRNTADNGTHQGILFVDNNLGGYIGFTNANGSPSDIMSIGGYGGINMQVGAQNTYAGKTTIGSFTSAGLAVTGAITATGNITTSATYARSAAGVGYLNGGYASQETSTTTGPIYCINSAQYAPTSTTFASMHGVGYTHSNTGLMVGGASGWGFYSVVNGVQKAFIGDGGMNLAGAITATGNITAYYSDERLKRKTGSIQNALEKVLSLNSFYYVNNELASTFGYTSTNQQVGLSAQEVEKVLPEIVSLAPFDLKAEKDGTIVSKSGENYKTIDYSKLVPLLIEAIKDLNAKVDSLQTQLNNK